MKMKNLDLNKYGVQEMNAAEMRETNGGSLWSWLEGAAVDVWEWITKHGNTDGTPGVHWDI